MPETPVSLCPVVGVPVKEQVIVFELSHLLMAGGEMERVEAVNPYGLPPCYEEADDSGEVGAFGLGDDYSWGIPGSKGAVELPKEEPVRVEPDSLFEISACPEGEVVFLPQPDEGCEEFCRGGEVVEEEGCAEECRQGFGLDKFSNQGETLHREREHDFSEAADLQKEPGGVIGVTDEGVERAVVFFEAPFVEADYIPGFELHGGEDKED